MTVIIHSADVVGVFILSFHKTISVLNFHLNFGIFVVLPFFINYSIITKKRPNQLVLRYKQNMYLPCSKMGRMMTH